MHGSITTVLPAGMQNPEVLCIEESGAITQNASDESFSAHVCHPIISPAGG